MCGIAGYLNIGSKNVLSTRVVWNMLQVQKHRGPDDSGIRAFNLNSGESKELRTEEPYSFEGNFEGILGFNRLSILDLSMNGHQPMVSPDNKVILVLNGEIYNAFDHKHSLEDWGFHFKSTSDTEIVLALYLKYGFEGMLERLNGMFAIVVIDLGKRSIYIARDRFGIKPMYYILNSDTFAFSSELKSFRYLDNFSFRLAEEQLDEFLLFRNNLRGTLFKDIQSLDPGYYLSYSYETGLVKKQFFDLNKYSRSSHEPESISVYSDKLEKWLSKSVKSQLMSDVKLGCQLSGGIDSSMVTWLANRNSDNGNFETVSIIFNDTRYSEEKFINKITEKFSIPSHHFLLDSEYYFENIEKATWHLEAPINHPNTIGLFMLSQRAKEFVTVLLSGEGADEVFGGYSRFYDLSYPLRNKNLLHEIKENLTHPGELASHFDPVYRSVMATAFMTPVLAGKLRKEFGKEHAIRDRRSLYQSLTGSLFDRQVKYEMHSYLPDLLIRQDKMSMAHSIENRVPFLDNEIVESSFTIPEKYLVLRKSPEGYNNEKYLLKKIIAKTFGDDFAFRDKMGFGIPYKEFFLNKVFFEYLTCKVLPGIKGRGLFNHKIVSDWLSDIRNLRYSEREALWIVVTFEIWASIYLDDNYENWHTSD